MDTERALERLQDQLALQRRRLRHGLVALAVAGASIVGCLLLIEWALPFVLSFTVGIGALTLGIMWSVDGGVRAGLSARAIRRLEQQRPQLPEARVIDW